MTSTKADPMAGIAADVLEAFDKVNGPQPGYRPAHAKGMLVAGRFTPAPEAASLTRAPHAARPSTLVTVRFSDTTGIPTIPDNDPNAGPRGIAIRFHLADHVHTDIIGHSVDGFPARTIEEFLELLRAIGASGPGVAHPTPVEAFLGTHPAALAYVQAPRPLPVSFTRETFYSVNAHRFLNREGASRYGRYRIRPDGPGEYLDSEAAAKQSSDFLFADLRAKLSNGAPPKMRIAVQLAGPGDAVNDATAHWPKDRPEVPFGTVQLESVLLNTDTEQQHIIFDPIPRVDGIEPSDDPLLEPRATVYLMSGRRRRAQQRM